MTPITDKGVYMSHHPIDFSRDHRENFHAMLANTNSALYDHVVRGEATYGHARPHIFAHDRNTVVTLTVVTKAHPHGNEVDAVYRRYGLNEVVPNYGLAGEKTYRLVPDDLDERGAIRDLHCLKKAILTAIFEVEEFLLDSEFLLIVDDHMTPRNEGEEVIVKLIVVSTSYLFLPYWELTVTLVWPIKGKSLADIRTTTLDGFVAR